MWSVCWLLLAFLALNVEIRRGNVEIRSGNWGVGRRFGFCGTRVGIGFWADWLASVVGFVSQKLCETGDPTPNRAKVWDLCIKSRG